MKLNQSRDVCLGRHDRHQLLKIKCNVSFCKCFFADSHLKKIEKNFEFFLADLELKNNEWNFDFNKEKPIGDKFFVWETVSGT